MRVLSTVEQPIGVGHGPYKGWKRRGRPSFVVGKGKHITIIQWATASDRLIWFIHSRYLALPALSLEQGVLHCDIIEGAFDTATFQKFIECTLDQMQPFPAPNSAIVMDNCHIHKHPDILHLIESQYELSASMYLMTIKLTSLPVACGVNSCRCTLQTTTQSNCSSLPWSIAFTAMGCISVFQWTNYQSKRFMQFSPKQSVILPCKMLGGGIITVDMSSSLLFGTIHM